MSELYTIPEVAKLLKTNKNKVYQYIKQGALKATKIGSLKVKQEWIEEFVEKNMVLELNPAPTN